jgi:hypothetical protein
MKTIIHVNQHKIKANRKTGSNDPVLTVKTYKSNTYGHSVSIRDANGVEVAKVIYSPDKPLSCGARVWIEAMHEVVVDGHEESPSQIGYGVFESGKTGGEYNPKGLGRLKVMR